MRELKELEKKIGYHFQNPELLEKALRHSSYANEHRMNRIECNERLEFLGDAVLEHWRSVPERLSWEVFCVWERAKR